ncbi:MAG: hypothetical protein JW941_01785 [Candidatus Coatesbacteria bacterium]|nr:hypothetical protein [Candidatus Coatesbacteria bacterium]
MTVFVGDYGSGKTEVSLNFALALRTIRDRVKIVDLDIVNPYFRSREATGILGRSDVELVAPEGDKAWADLPIILPGIAGAIQDETAGVVLDVGGEAAGSRVLSSLFDGTKHLDYDLLAVVNANRPFTADADGSMTVLNKIEKASGLRVSGIVSNTHLLNNTTPEMVIHGLELAESIAERLGVDVRFMSVMESVADKIDGSSLSAPIFAIKRYVLLPWETGSDMSERGRDARG